MLENKEDVQKIMGFLKKKGFEFSESEIEKVAQNLYEVGLFLVRLKVKQHSEARKQPNVENGGPPIDKPP